MQYKWIALSVTSVGGVMAGLDIRILVVGLPTIASQLHIGPEDVIWISQAYMLATTVSLLIFGRVADQFGRVKLYNLGFIVFTLGSGLASISGTSFELIAFRAVQGIGYSLLSSSTAAIITDATPKKELGLIMGISQTAFRAGAMSGLTLSGLILSFVSWRGLFYVNIPIGIFGTIWAFLKLREIGTSDTSKKIDWYGFGLFSAGLTLVLLAITFLSYGTEGYLEGGGFLATGLAILALFVRIESRQLSPMLDLKLFRDKLFAVANIAQLLVTTSWTGVTLLVAFYLELGLGYSPLNAGLGIIPLEAVYLVFAIIAGRLSDMYGSRLISTSGIFILVASNISMIFLGTNSGYLGVALILSMFGIGIGMFNAPNLSAIMSSVPLNRRGIAASFRQTMFNIGSTISYGLIILFITFGIPYSNLNQLLQGSVSQGVILAARAQFVHGFHIAAIMMAILTAAAIIPSAMRGNRVPLPA